MLSGAGRLGYQNTACALVRAFSRSMAVSEPRGAFILFEGVDRSGKSTQARKLVEALTKRGVPAKLWNFPDRTTWIGSAINEYLTTKVDLADQAVHLLFCANRQEKRNELIAMLRSGTTLVVDRYAYSGVAYSAAKGTAGMDISWCKGPDQGLPAPDLVIYLRANSAVATAREGFGEERYEKPEFQDKVRAVFEQLQEPDWLVQDASLPIEQIHQQVLEESLDVIKRCQECEPIRQLWDQQPLLQAQHVQQEQQHRAVGKHAKVVTASPVKQPRMVLHEQQQQQQQLPPVDPGRC